MPNNPRYISTIEPVQIQNPYVIFYNMVPASFSWDDNAQNNYFIVNSTGSNIPITAGKYYVDTNGKRQTILLNGASLNIQKDGANYWTEVPVATSVVGTNSATATNVATYSHTGIVKIGTGITVTDDGTISILPTDSKDNGGKISWNSITGIPAFSTLAFTGSYTDLVNKPNIPAPVNLIPGSNVTITGTYPNYTINSTAVQSAVDWNNVLNKPSLFSGAYADLSGKPTLATVATTGSYDDLTSKPVIPSTSNVVTSISVTGLRALTTLPASGTIRISDTGKDGNWYYDSTDTSSADNTGTIIVDGSGRRWKRIFNTSVSVMWFGAVGDGSTDDTAAIQACIDTVSANTGIDFNFRQYKVTTITVLNKANLTLFGQGAVINGLLMIGTTNVASTSFYYNLKIKGLKFDQSVYSDSLSRDSINICNAYKIDIIECSFKGGNACIRVNGINKSTHSGQISIRQNITEADNTKAFDSRFPNYFFFGDNTVKTLPYSGITNQSADVSIQNNNGAICNINNVISFGQDGILIEGNTFFMQGGLYVTQNKCQNIRIVSSNWVHIHDNNLFEAGQEAILIEVAAQVNITDNNIAWPGQRDIAQGYGIRITGGGTPDTSYMAGVISGNVINLPTRTGIKLDANSHEFLVFGNQMKSVGNASRYYGDGHNGQGSQGNVGNTPSINTYTHYAIDKDISCRRCNIFNNETDVVVYNFPIDDTMAANIVSRSFNNMGNFGVFEKQDGTAITTITSNTITVPTTDFQFLNISGGGSIGTINGATTGTTITFYNNNATSVIFTNGANIALQAGIDYVLPNKGLITLRKANSGVWYEVSRSGIVNDYYATSFNLKGNGTTDDSAAFQAMIDAIPANSRLIFNKTLNYKFTTTINFTKPINIIASVAGVTFTQTTNYTSLFYVTSNDVTFENLNIVQTGKGDESNFPVGYGAGIIIRFCTGGNRITRCSFLNCGDYLAPKVLSDNGVNKSSAGVYISRSGNVTVTDCSFTQSLEGVGIDAFGSGDVGTTGYVAVTNNRILRNNFTDCFKGLELDYTDAAGGKGDNPGEWASNTFIKTDAYDNANALQTFAMLISGNFATSGLLVHHNYVAGGWGNAVGVLKGSYYTQITHNDITGVYTGISLFTQTGSQVVQKINVSHNNISYCKSYAIIGVSSYDSKISYNTIQYNTWGIQLNSYCFNFEISHNEIAYNTRYGIGIQAAIGPKVINNNIYGNGTDLVNGDTCGIIINKANSTQQVTNVRIQGNNFDYAYSASAALVQTYAIKTIGNYQWASGNSPTGIVKDNYYGRTINSESLASNTNGLIYQEGSTTTDHIVYTVPSTISFAVTTQTYVVLSDLTGQTNRTIVLPPSPRIGQTIVFVNKNNSAFNWVFNTNVTDYAGNNSTAIPTMGKYTIVWNGSNWDIS